MSTPNERIVKAKELFEKFPNNDLSRYNLAQAHFDAGDFATAADHLRPLCDKKPDWMVAQILLGKCLLQAGQRDEAKKSLQRALQLAIDQHHDGPREELEELLKTL
jgi:Flp pilus assembly protein TadD